MKSTKRKARPQVLFGFDPLTRDFIAGGDDLPPVQARLRLSTAAIELLWTLHWAGPLDVVFHVLGASASEAGIEDEEFERIVRAADRYAERHYVCPGSLPIELHPLVYGEGHRQKSSNQSDIGFTKPPAPPCPVCDQPTEVQLGGRPYCKRCEVSFCVLTTAVPSKPDKPAGGDR